MPFGRWIPKIYLVYIRVFGIWDLWTCLLGCAPAAVVAAIAVAVAVAVAVTAVAAAAAAVAAAAATHTAPR